MVPNLLCYRHITVHFTPACTYKVLRQAMKRVEDLLLDGHSHVLLLWCSVVMRPSQMELRP